MSELPPNAPQYNTVPTSPDQPSVTSPPPGYIPQQQYFQQLQAYPPQGYPPQPIYGQPFQGYAQPYPTGYSSQPYPIGQPNQDYHPQQPQPYPIGQPNQDYHAQPHPYQDLSNPSGPLLAEEDPKTTLVEREHFIQKWTESDYEVTIKKWFCEAWEVFKMEWVPFVILLLCQGLLFLIPHVGWIFALVPAISFKVFGLHVIRQRETKGEPLYSHKTYFSGVNYFVPILVLSILWGIVILLGFICLIIPGIFLLVCSIFSVPLLLEYYDEYVSFGDTFMMSVKVVQKNFWWILAFEILTFLLAISGVLLLGVGLLITVPVAQLSVLVAFKDIYGLNPHRKPEGPIYFLCGKSQ